MNKRISIKNIAESLELEAHRFSFASQVAYLDSEGFSASLLIMEQAPIRVEVWIGVSLQRIPHSEYSVRFYVRMQQEKANELFIGCRVVGIQSAPALAKPSIKLDVTNAYEPMGFPDEKRIAKDDRSQLHLYLSDLVGFCHSNILPEYLDYSLADTLVEEVSRDWTRFVFHPIELAGAYLALAGKDGAFESWRKWFLTERQGGGDHNDTQYVRCLQSKRSQSNG